jgi:hypothetical protein
MSDLRLLHGLHTEQLRDWLHQAFAYNYSQVDAMRRESAAKGLGLDPSQYNRPFPGSQTTITDNSVKSAPSPPVALPVAPPSGAGSLVKGVLLATALLAGGTGAGFGIAALLRQPAPPMPAPAPFDPKDWQLKIVDGDK